MKGPDYSVLLFESVSRVLKAEKILKAHGIAHKVIPVPRQISSDCGVCIRIAPGEKDCVETALKGKVDILETFSI